MRLTLGRSALSTIEPISIWRFRLVSLEVRMWRWKARPRLTLPVPVFLKRLAAPECVFSFGIIHSLRIRTRLQACHRIFPEMGAVLQATGYRLLLRGRQDQVQSVAF